MKRSYGTMLWLLMMTYAMPTPTKAQSGADSLDALLTRLLSDTPAARANLADDLARVAPEQVQSLCNRLIEPGRGDDAAIRTALHGVVLAAGRPGMEARRAQIERVLIEGLAASPPALVRDFLLEQLGFIGSEASIDIVARQLDDEATCRRAAMVLTTIGGKEVKKALHARLTTVRGACRIAVLKALGDLRDPTGLAEVAATTDPAQVELWRTLLYALSASGHPAMTVLCNDLLGPAQATDHESWYERCYERALALSAAARVARTTARDDIFGAVFLREILKNHAGPENSGLRCAALSYLVEALGIEALPDILIAMASDDPELASVAVETAVTMQDPATTTGLIEALRSTPPAVQLMLLDILARRGDPSAFDAVSALARSDDPEVRPIAIQAAARLGGEKVLPLLLDMLSDEKDDRAATAAGEALFALRGARVNTALADALPSSDERQRTAILKILARRGAGEVWEDILVYAQDRSDGVRAAAFEALADLAPISALPRMLECYRTTAGETALAAGASAIAAVGRRCDDRNSCSDQIVAVWRQLDADRQAALLRVFCQIGGSAALDIVRDHLQSERAALREAALAAIYDWPGAEGFADALRLARDSVDTREHVLAVRACLRMMESAEGQSEADRLAALGRVLYIVRRPEERKLVLAGVAKLGLPEGIDLIRPHLTDPACGVEAAHAILQLVDRLIPGRCDEARRVIACVQPQPLPEGVASELKRIQEKLATYEDYITSWDVSGPYTLPGRRGQELMDTPFPPEDPTATGVIWREQPLSPDPARAWLADINLNPEIAGNHRAAYLHTRIYSPVEQQAYLEVSSDDGVRAWVNGTVVLTNNSLRGAAPGQDKVVVTLNAGWNDLSLKVCNDGGAWVGAARFRTVHGGRLGDLRIERGFSPP